MKIQLALLALGAIGVAPGLALGGVTFQGGSYMTFSNAFSGGPNLNSIVNQNVRGGISTTTFSTDVPDPNILTFTGQANFASDAEVPFTIGQLSYHNGITYTGDQGVTGAFTVVFDAPPGLPTTNFAFDFDFIITQNTTGDPNLDADFLSFTLPLAPTVFTVGTTQYTLAITGFQLPSGGFFTTLNLPEGGTVNADVIAVFTTNIVPGPGAAGVIGLAGLVAMRRRR